MHVEMLHKNILKSTLIGLCLMSLVPLKTTTHKLNGVQVQKVTKKLQKLVGMIGSKSTQTRIWVRIQDFNEGGCNIQQHAQNC